MTKNLSYYPSLDKAVDVYKPGSVTLITGKTVAHRYFLLNLMVEQLLNNEDSVCLLNPDQFAPTTYELVSILAYKLDPVNKIKALGLLASWASADNPRLIIPTSKDYDLYSIEGIVSMIQSQEKVTHIFIERGHGIITYDTGIGNYDGLIRRVMTALNSIAEDKGVPIVLGVGDDTPDAKRDELVAIANTPVGDLLPSSLFPYYSELILGVDIELDNFAPLKMMIHVLKGDHNKEVELPVLLDYYPGEALITEQGKLPK
jgi:hypothetical protein